MTIATNLEQKIKDLEKANRILQKKLQRSEADRINLEENNHKKESLLKQVIKEFKTTQLQLVHNEKMSSLGQLVAGVAHEINNPVNFIHGNIFHAREYILDLLRLVKTYEQTYSDISPEIKDLGEEIDLEFIHQDLPKLINSMQIGAERIREIVNSLRTFSRLDEAEVKAVDIHEGIDSTLMILQNRLKAKNEQTQNIEVRKYYGELPKIQCYAGQLNQVFMNIIANAIDALQEMENNKNKQENQLLTISIHTSVLANHRVAIKIIDNGSGIPEEIQKNIFNPFFTTKPVGQGTGLGMSISHQIITEMHDGSLTCSSEIGKGTCFTIEIPVKHGCYSS
ncbi:sensor histidine kinase [Mastigocoleus testarum]|uniref:histidine kinase n=1 Tax=Mastigocoleus testarum BC008 TaxID=371196 RepID=A0A0V7ZLF4_9CYAN|nr:ATP-binding protein [Mastigocoleus testarum]KST62797.1 ATPase [Mastigocoleus testarum BC008]KST65110.1 ATPase [Mastigocoleus testarum BC008]